MVTRIPHYGAHDKLPSDFSLPILHQVYPRELICTLLTRLGRWETRERKLNQFLVVSLLLAWALFPSHSLRSVFSRVTSSLRLLENFCAQIVPTSAALTYRRKQLGVRFFRLLMRQACRPLATPQTPGAFAFGLRLVGIDGTLEDVTETAENARFFGRINQGETKSPFPQIQGVSLVEVGTHAILDAVLAPCKADEHRLSWGLLPRLSAGMLLLHDRGFTSAAFFEAVRGTGAHILGRLSQGIFTRREQVLADGSYLTTLSPKTCEGLKAPMRVRVIEYTIAPTVADELVNVVPSRMHSKSTGINPDVLKVHRLVTTLLDPVAYPALDMCVLYHERWEVECVIDETKNHLRISQTPLRSHLPVLALQELYALLLAHYAVCTVMVGAAHTQPTLDPDRISFTGTLQAIGDVLRLSGTLEPSQVTGAVKAIFQSVVQPEALVEPRRVRFNSRVVKHICTRYRCKKPFHAFITLPATTTFRDLLLL